MTKMTNVNRNTLFFFPFQTYSISKDLVINESTMVEKMPSYPTSSYAQLWRVRSVIAQCRQFPCFKAMKFSSKRGDEKVGGGKSRKERDISEAAEEPRI
jgi:hypothetical protein